MDEHKIQSSNENLIINLFPVAKRLHKIKEVWNPDSFVITFKLETNEDILMEKSFSAMTKTKSDIVVANILKERYNRVFILNKNKIIFEILKNNMKNIEEGIVKKIVELHHEFMNY